MAAGGDTRRRGPKERQANSHLSEPASSLKGSGIGENFHEVEKRKDIYKLLHDSETGYKDHWRDEERETKSAIHRDHRRERWPDNSMWHSGERRNSSRWSDSGNREISFDQRRESKWNTCWGPNDKESQSSKDDDGPHQRIVSRLSGHGRNMVKEGEMHSRSWRSNSSMTSGKAQPSYQNPFTPQQIHIPGYDCGNGENGLPLSPSGSSLLRYSRIKLLSIYSSTDLRSQRARADGIIEIPSVMQSELLEPLGILSPTIEELVILKAIEKGEVGSSSEPLKDGNVGRNTVDPVMTKQMNPGPWRSESEDISRWSSADLEDNPAAFEARSSEVSWSHLFDDENRSNPKRHASKISAREESARIFLAQEDSPSSKVNSASRNFEPNPPPEGLSLCYRDPHGRVQGPFSESDLIGWFEAGYFGIDLEVRPSDAPPNTPFLLLGDVIPQLRSKFRPPPGFCAANPSEIQDMPDREKSGSTAFDTFSGIVHRPSKSMQRSEVLVSTEAHNWILESPSTTNLRSSTIESRSEGMLSREHVLSPVFTPSYLGEDGSGVNYLLAQKRLLEQQLQPQNLPSLSHFVDHPANLSATVSSEQLRPLDINHNTQMLNMLAQHYLLSQPPMEPHVSLPSQFSLFNKCLLLKQELQRQQQQLLLQQQLFLSQVLSGHQSSLDLGEPSQKLCSLVPEGDVPTELLLKQAQNAYINQKMPADNLHKGHNSTSQTVNLHDRKNIDNSLSCSVPSSLHLPHQLIASSSKKPESDQDIGDNCPPEVLLPSGILNTSLISDASVKLAETLTYSENELSLKCYAKEARPLMPTSGEFAPSEYPVLSQKLSCTSGLVSPIADQIHDLKISSDDNDVEQHHTYASAAKYSKTLEVCQTKKTAEKKARKKKNAKSQLALELPSGFSITDQPENPKSKFESEDVKPQVLSDAQMDLLKPLNGFAVPAVDDNYDSSPCKTADSHKSFLPPLDNDNNKEAKRSNMKAECMDSGISELSPPRAWKVAPGIKAKSLKEIQLEEQQRVQMETVGSFDHNSKLGRDSVQVDGNTEYLLNPESNFNSKSRKSHLHDLLAEEVLAKSSGTDTNLSRDTEKQVLLPVLSTVTLGDLSTIEEDFVAAKDIKKGRKKTLKSKVTEGKNTSPVGSFDPFSHIVVEKRTSQHSSQNENYVLPAPLNVPSLADFVSQKGEQTDSSQASAWPMDVGKFHKPTSLRDIQKEEENKVSTKENIHIPSPAKLQPTLGNRGTGSWQVPQSSPSSHTSPMQSSTLTSRMLKSKIDNDLFGDPIDQSKQQRMHVELYESNCTEAPAEEGPLRLMIGEELAGWREEGMTMVHRDRKRSVECSGYCRCIWCGRSHVVAQNASCSRDCVSFGRAAASRRNLLASKNNACPADFRRGQLTTVVTASARIDSMRHLFRQTNP
ncbi:hypothetical protein KSP39_PZI002950 [Platanthera zijinensis]|uniref:GYF domain-containing protein n=1 Tax=Platanthera zijinensis TaxID=2320716 RepID=A0AAP0BX46_9ASPA